MNKLGLPCLDVGCGEGQLAAYISVPYTGFDGSAEAIRKASYGTYYSMQFPKKFCVARFESFSSGESYGTIIFGGIMSVLVKPEKRVSLIEDYIKKFQGKYVIIYDLEHFDSSEIDQTFHLYDEYHATAEVKDLQEVKKHRKILTYKVCQ